MPLRVQSEVVCVMHQIGEVFVIFVMGSSPIRYVEQLSDMLKICITLKTVDKGDPKRMKRVRIVTKLVTDDAESPIDNRIRRLIPQVHNEWVDSSLFVVPVVTLESKE